MLVMQNKSFKEFYFYFHNKLFKNQGGVATSPHLTRCLRKGSLSFHLLASVQLLLFSLQSRLNEQLKGTVTRIGSFEISKILVVCRHLKKNEFQTVYYIHQHKVNAFLIIIVPTLRKNGGLWGPCVEDSGFFVAFFVKGRNWNFIKARF
jgi:hypothetical protein